MEILKVNINNFLTIGNADLALNEKGLVLLRGENLDDPSASSNGAGKSSIPDAIYWGIYGETARGESGDSVVNHIAKKNCRVIITLQDGDTIYTIARHRKDTLLKNVTQVRSISASAPAGTAWTTLEKGTEKETQALINEIMGCSKEVFSASIYAGQEQMPDLPRMTDKQLKTLIEEASGTERLEKAYVIAGRKLLASKNVLDNLANHRMRIETRLADVKARAMGAARSYKEFEDTRDERAADMQKDIERIELEKADLLATIEKLPKMEEIDKALTTIATKLASHRGMMTEKSRLEAERRDIAAKHFAAEHAAIAAEGALAKVVYAHDNAETELLKPCGECGKPHTLDEIEEYKAHQKRLIEGAQHNADKANAARKDMKRLMEAKDAEIAAYVATIPDVTELSEKQSKLNAVKGRISAVTAARLAKDADIEVIKTKIKAAKEGDNPHKALLASLGTEKKAIEFDLAETIKNLAKQEKEVEMREVVAKVFSPAGVRAHILDTVTPFLNDRTAEYLTALSDGSITAVWSTLAETTKGELREKFNIEVSNTHGAKSFGGLSGGEKRKVRLATMLALQDLVASRASKPINLWIGDEVDDALDAAGLERLMGIMESKARERGTVLVISHNDLTDWIDNISTVTKSGGVSSVTGALAV